MALSRLLKLPGQMSEYSTLPTLRSISPVLIETRHLSALEPRNRTCTLSVHSPSDASDDPPGLSVAAQVSFVLESNLALHHPGQ